MVTLTHSFTGFVHLLSAMLALLSGTLVLTINKGTKLHKRLGYFYLGSMVVLNATAFGIYRLLETFGPFHVAAILSLATLMMGFLPALFRTPGNWIEWHVPGMYYCRLVCSACRGNCGSCSDEWCVFREGIAGDRARNVHWSLELQKSI